MGFDIVSDALHDIRLRLEGVEAEAARFREFAAPAIRCLDGLYWPDGPDHSRVALLGSWSRETAVFGLSDFNVAYELPQKHVEKDPATLIEEIHSRLSRVFEAVERRPRSRSVAVTLRKGLVIDIRPYFWMKSGEMGFPDPELRDHWYRFEPMLARNAILKLDPMERKNFFVICRIARVWRAVHHVPISGALLDTLGLDFIAKALHRRKDRKYHDCLVRDFFGYLADRDSGQDYWRVSGATEPVRRTGQFESLAAAAYTVSQMAIEKAAAGQEKSAIAAWRYLLKDFYPAY
jgi:Second Messenger Oligonucleotide or Dinucleotide Synthetase domain